MGSAFHPIVERWFERRFGAPTEPQALAWPEIAARRDVLGDRTRHRILLR